MQAGPTVIKVKGLSFRFGGRDFHSKACIKKEESWSSYSEYVLSMKSSDRKSKEGPAALVHYKLV